MKIAVVRECHPQERRVALVPESCDKLVRAGFDIGIESGAGAGAGYGDASYRVVDADIETDPRALVQSADILLRVNPPSNLDGRSEVDWIQPSTIIVGTLVMRYMRACALACCTRV